MMQHFICLGTLWSVGSRLVSRNKLNCSIFQIKDE